MRAGSADRNSTLALSLSALVPMLGFILAMKSHFAPAAATLPNGFRFAILPGLPAIAWCGVIIAAAGLLLRLWAVLQLRERYTRTLLIQERQSVERGGPYRWVRHPGYLGSLFCLNGIALASGNWTVLLASLAATAAAYGYRIKVEDQMLVAALGAAYAEYRAQVGAILPGAGSSSR
jgi:protein-S-isoprenylcysteine O-methyltransferase Ste14